jgi:hypothetical protein
MRKTNDICKKNILSDRLQSGYRPQRPIFDAFGRGFSSEITIFDERNFARVSFSYIVARDGYWQTPYRMALFVYSDGTINDGCYWRVSLNIDKEIVRDLYRELRSTYHPPRGNVFERVVNAKIVDILQLIRRYGGLNQSDTAQCGLYEPIPEFDAQHRESANVIDIGLRYVTESSDRLDQEKSLQRWCRVAIRRCTGPNDAKLDELSLPIALKRFLKYE